MSDRPRVPEVPSSAETIAEKPPRRDYRPSSAVTVGWVTLALPSVLDLFVIAIGGANACHQNNPVTGWGFIVLVLVPIALVAGGVTTLVMASDQAKSQNVSPAAARSLGVIALVLAVIALPVNFFAAMSWVVCF